FSFEGNVEWAIAGHSGKANRNDETDRDEERRRQKESRGAAPLPAQTRSYNGGHAPEPISHISLVLGHQQSSATALLVQHRADGGSRRHPPSRHDQSAKKNRDERESSPQENAGRSIGGGSERQNDRSPGEQPDRYHAQQVL